ncbi:stalk domain-containing protein [Paenibacillus sp. NEAU-GSW1]|uniref:stalk domain-containing protein n=1 Tax=Paenibacillus sp. NEAU-GSW1 TaxID=2682486 RepID=UPI0012E27DD1|nr:stalk domain-containing protein [Paenibacillus sp. NEAU-GSW1]MUT66141.1 copper amine oxidase [Paenibacillus sp. NEAU-GSW1]
MKWSKIAILLIVLSLCGGTFLFADAASQKVRVILNGSEQDESGVIIDGKAYLPLRQLAGSLHAIVNWDNQSKKATLYKPNVHMILFQDKVVFGNVDKGNRYTFNVLSQIDNLTTDVSAVKVSITDPYGTEKVIQSQSVNITKDSFWYRTEDIKYNFEFSGKYAVRFYMKTSASDEWTVVSEKLISSQ